MNLLSWSEGYPACGGVGIVTMGLEDSIIHKDTEVFILYISLFYYRLWQIPQKSPLATKLSQNDH